MLQGHTGKNVFVLIPQDDDNELTKSEFKKFLFPHLGDGPSASGNFSNNSN